MARVGVVVLCLEVVPRGRFDLGNDGLGSLDFPNIWVLCWLLAAAGGGGKNYKKYFFVS